MNVIVSFTTKPGSIRIKAPNREPIILWSKAEAWDLVIGVIDAYKKAWPE